MTMIDYHIHTRHSIDAEGSIKEYCEQALKHGLKEICITNHCELDPFRNDSFIRFNNHDEPFTRDSVLKLQDEVLKENKNYRSSGLSVRFGLEVGFYDGIAPQLEKLIDGLQLDFLIGSIHCLNHICVDSSREHAIYFAKHGAAELLGNYFQEVKKLVKSQLFDTLGHFDVYKKYGLTYYGEKIHKIPHEIIREVFHLVAENELGLEINTAGLRRINEFYPSPDIMELAKEQGVKLITIGSDSHQIGDLGRDIKLGLEYAKSFGFQRVYGFKKREPIGIDI